MKKIFILIIFTLVLLGCSSDDDGISVDPENCEFQPILGAGFVMSDKIDDSLLN